MFKFWKKSSGSGTNVEIGVAGPFLEARRLRFEIGNPLDSWILDQNEGRL